MKLTFDLREQKISVDGIRDVPLYSDEGFAIVKDLWLKVGWNQKYTYTFTWFGVPIIQFPDDLLRYQEVVFSLRPDVIIETGVAHGGSLVYSASLCRLIGQGHVIGIDVEIKPHNRARLERHPLKSMIRLIEGSSTAPDVIERVRALVQPDDRVLLLLDSDHGYAHVMAELTAYAPLVSVGSYIIVADGIMRNLTDVPRGRAQWATDNPASAAEDFAAAHPEFSIEEPAWPFNESTLRGNVTHWPNAWLKRVA